MTATRSTKLEHAYQRQRQKSRKSKNECPFCIFKDNDPHFIEETSMFRVIRNIAPYSIWDGQGVKDHLLLIPKQHTEKLGDLNDAATTEFLNLITKYEENGYNMYARAPTSRMKSVVHQHTHLILPNNKHTNFILYFRKPFYIRMSK